MKRVALENRINQLEQQLKELRRELFLEVTESETVLVQDKFKDLFLNIEKKIHTYFNDLNIDPKSGEITAEGQRYVLMRTDSLSHEFIDFIKDRYNDRPVSEAINIGNNFLYDNAMVVGKKDAIAFHEKLNLTAPIEKLSAGPIHFAYTGWANVELLKESNPTPGDDFYLKFIHHNSFEAQSWIKSGKKSDVPVCTMSCGYSAGWCEESFNVPLTTVEVSCEAKGDDACVFIMAPTDKIGGYIVELANVNEANDVEIPIFFKRKNIEEKLRESLKQKELLIQEIHHRVKNNLQVISSLLKVQMSTLEDDTLHTEFEASINRVNTMGMVHELMYQSKNFDKVKMRDYMHELLTSIIKLYTLNQKVEIDLNIDVPEIDLTLDQSLPLALVINEIICNSFKHGLVNGGKIHVKLTLVEDTFELIIGDNGPGFVENEDNSGLGLILINILLEQIDAKKELVKTSEGFEYQIKFKLKKV